MDLKILNVLELKPYENNPRYNEDAIEAVANSIKEFGFKVPIIIDKDNVIIAGHTRLKAALRLGMEEVPCIVADDLTEDQVKAFRLADNKVGEIATWDFEKLLDEMNEIKLDMSMFGFDHASLKDEKEEIKDDNYDVEGNIPEEHYSQKGDIYILGGGHRVMCGDSTIEEDVDKLVNGAEINLLQTDPPYNINYGSKAEAINKYGYQFSDRYIENDFMPSEDFIDFLTKAFANAVKYMKKGASFYIWHASTTILEFELALRTNNLKTRQQLIWNKNALVLSRQDYHWKHEPCLYGWKEGAAHHFINDRTLTTVYDDDELNFNKMKKEELVKLLEHVYLNAQKQTLINQNKPSRSEEHPTMKPVKIIADQIINSSKQGENVLDLFAGSGTTLIASEQANRKAFLMEFDEKFVDVIIKRYFALNENENITLIRNGKEISFEVLKEKLEL